LTWFGKKAGRDISVPFTQRRTSKGGFELLVVSGILWLALVCAMFCAHEGTDYSWEFFAGLGVLSALMLGPVCVLGCIKLLRRIRSKYAPTSARLPLVLHGTSQGGHGMALFSGVMVLCGVGSILFGLIGEPGGRDAGIQFLPLATGILVAALFGIMLIFSLRGIYEGLSRLRITESGLEIRGAGRVRRIPWGEIAGFRLGHTSLKIDSEAGIGDDAVRKDEVVGPVKVILHKGEYDLPDRYGMSLVELRSLLHLARIACMNNGGPAEVAEPFGTPGDLAPVLQRNDLGSLLAAGRCLAEYGFSGSVVPVAQLKESESQSWVSPERGGCVLCLSTDQDRQKAMQVLAEHMKAFEV